MIIISNLEIKKYERLHVTPHIFDHFSDMSCI